MTPDPIDPSRKDDNNKDARDVPRNVARIAVWDFAGRLANFSVSFVVGIVLTRLLSPEQFGAFAIVLAVITFSSIFIDLGFRSAIIQHQNTTQQQMSTVFFVNLVVGICLIGIFITAARPIEDFYQIEGMRNYIIAASFLFGINALSLVPGGLLQKELRLKTFSIINTVAAALSGIVATYLALTGFGVWALVWQQLLSASFILIGVVYMSAWLPSLSFKLRSITELWTYGSRLFLSGFVDALFSRLDVFVIGKLFPIQTLGYYNRAQSLDSLVRTFSSSTTASVAFPVIAKMGDDVNAVRDFYRRCLHVVSFLSFLLIGVLFLTCFDIVIILFTEKWSVVGNYFRIMAITGFVYPISALMVNLIAARGNSRAFLKLELLKKGVLFPTYLSFFVGGVYFFLVALGSAFILALIINAHFVSKEILVPIKDQFKAIYLYGVIAILGTAVTFLATIYVENIYLHLTASSLLFAVFYLFFCYILNLSGLREIFDRGVSFYNDKRHTNISPAA